MYFQFPFMYTQHCLPHKLRTFWRNRHNSKTFIPTQFVEIRNKKKYCQNQLYKHINPRENDDCLTLIVVSYVRVVKFVFYNNRINWR